MKTKTEKKKRGEKQKRVSVRLPKDLYKQLNKAHWVQRKSMNDLIIEALREKLW